MPRGARTKTRKAKSEKARAAPVVDPRVTGVVYPFKYYARYLVDSGHPDPIRQLQKDGFTTYTTSDFYDLVSTDVKRKPRKGKAAVRFALERGTYTMVSGDYQVEADLAFQILRNKPRRELAELVLMTRLPDDQLKPFFADILWTTTDKLPDGLVPFYKHYFWNTDELSIGDWFFFLFDMRVTDTEKPVPRYPGAQMLWTVLNLPSELGIWLIGWHDKAPIDKSEAMEMLFSAAFVNAMKAAGSEDMSGFQKASSVAIAAYGASQASVVDAAKVIEMLRGIDIRRPEEMHPVDIRSVTGGQHSSRPTVLRLLPKPDETED